MHLIITTHTKFRITAKDNPDGIPTPRAIAERLNKIRTDAKADFSIAGSKGTGSAKSTPRKKTTPKTPDSKRKRGATENLKDVAMKLEDVLDTPSAKRIRIKSEPKTENGGILDAEEFTPRVKREISVPTPHHGVVPFYGFADEGNVAVEDTSGSEFTPADDDVEFEDANMA